MAKNEYKKQTNRKKTTIGKKRLKTSSMNKHKRRNQKG